MEAPLLLLAGTASASFGVAKEGVRDRLTEGLRRGPPRGLGRPTEGAGREVSDDDIALHFFF